MSDMKQNIKMNKPEEILNSILELI
jgi:hypothetical protein